MIFNFLRALFLDDLIEFLDFWFYHAPVNILRNYFDQVFSFEGILKLKSHLRNFKNPLYGDYSIIGYLIAIPYRLINIIFAIIFYLILLLFYLIAIFLWLIFPLLLLGYAILF